MSSIPNVDKPKYNKDSKFAWVDSQWEKLMTEQKKLRNEISELVKENIELKEKYNKLYKLYTEGTPTDGLEVGSPEDYRDDPQLKLFPPNDVY